MPARRPVPLIVLSAVGMVLLFILVQGAAIGLLDGIGADIDLDGSLDFTDALQLSLVQLLGIVTVGLLVVGGVVSWRRLGLVGTPAGSARAGWRALLPVTLLVLGPSIGLALATGDDLVHPSISVMEALAVTLLAVLIGANEELWFRGVVVDQLGGAARPWLVIAVSSLLFGLPHWSGSAATTLNAVGVALAVGVPFACVRLRCGSLLPLIAVHALIDIWAFLHTASVLAEGNPSAGEVAAGLVLPACIAAGYLTWFARGRRLEGSVGS